MGNHCNSERLVNPGFLPSHGRGHWIDTSIAHLFQTFAYSTSATRNTVVVFCHSVLADPRSPLPLPGFPGNDAHGVAPSSEKFTQKRHSCLCAPVFSERQKGGKLPGVDLLQGPPQAWSCYRGIAVLGTALDHPKWKVLPNKGSKVARTNDCP